MQSAIALLDPFDRGNGNGSRNQDDDWADEVSIFDNEWGSQAATTFNPREAPPGFRDKFEDLYKLQNGKGESNRKTTIRQSHIQNDMEIFMDVMEMPTYQRERVTHIVENLDLSSNNFGGTKYEKILLTVCSLVADEALSNSRDPDVNDRLFLTDDFKQLMRATGMSSSEHRQLRVSVRNKSDYF
jgi:hypothetical protein